MREQSFFKKWIIGELSWKRLLRSLVVIYALLCVVAAFGADRLIFPYQGQSSYRESLPGLRLIEAADGTRLAMRRCSFVAKPRYAVLYFHGNYEDVGNTDAIARELAAIGAEVFSLDYRGYGMSEGRPNESHCYADAEQAYREVLVAGYALEQVIVWGRSVGSGAATELARRVKARALVLESAFVSAFKVATRVSLLPFDRFKNEQKMAEVDEPLFLLHGAKDRTVSPWHSERLMAAHRGRHKRVLLPDADHNTLWLQELGGVWAELSVFLSATQ